MSVDVTTRACFDLCDCPIAGRLPVLIRTPLLLCTFCLCAASFGACTEASAQDRCRVADPTGTPLNVRAEPNGKVVDILNNGVPVKIIDHVSKSGKEWAYIGRIGDQHPAGWVFRDYLDCAQEEAASSQASQPQQNTLQPSFDCRKARTLDELAICSNPELSQLDSTVAPGYQYVQRDKGDEFVKQINLPLFRARQACGSDVNCIRERQIEAIRTYYNLGAPVSSSLWKLNGSTMRLVTKFHVPN
jgi:Bacterial SH3 domain